MSALWPAVISHEPPGFGFAMSEPWNPGEHPLQAVRERVDEILRDQRQLLAELPLRGEASWPATTALLRAMLLQLFYGVPGDTLWTEQLHYNLLYRWFVGLDAEPRDATAYARGRQRLHESSAGRILMRCLLLDERLQQLMRGAHFSPDRAQLGSWLADEQAVTAASTHQTTQRGGKLALARDYILDHLSDPGLGADRLARALCMSRRALFLLFAEQGLTPTRMIHELRLDRCKALLDDPRERCKIGAIALDHGFRDYVTFSRLFKARFGLAPSDFRKRAGQRG